MMQIKHFLRNRWFLGFLFLMMLGVLMVSALLPLGQFASSASREVRSLQRDPAGFRSLPMRGVDEAYTPNTSVLASSFHYGNPLTVAGIAYQASAAGSGWKSKDTDEFNVLSADKKARAFGAVQWYHGAFPFGYRHRGEYTQSPVVFAEKSVGCIWVQIKWGYPAGSISFPPGASIQGAEEVSNFFVSCRSRGSRYPAVLSLAGLAYAKALLNSSTLTVCTSAKKSDGPRYCGTKKMYYGLG